MTLILKTFRLLSSILEKSKFYFTTTVKHNVFWYGVTTSATSHLKNA